MISAGYISIGSWLDMYWLFFRFDLSPPPPLMFCIERETWTFESLTYEAFAFAPLFIALSVTFDSFATFYFVAAVSGIGGSFSWTAITYFTFDSADSYCSCFRFSFDIFPLFITPLYADSITCKTTYWSTRKDFLSFLLLYLFKYQKHMHTHIAWMHFVFEMYYTTFSNSYWTQ